jgi:hypothetical protein
MVVLSHDCPDQRSHDAHDYGGAEHYVEDDYECHIHSLSGQGSLKQAPKITVGST